MAKCNCEFITTCWPAALVPEWSKSTVSRKLFRSVATGCHAPPAARTIEITSTATAAQLAQDKPGAAAIASVQAGVHYGLNVLAENIEDNQGNVTRFAVIGEESAQRTGHDKMATMFEVEHRPGALADSMNIFKRNRLNLTWIESFPIARPTGWILILRRTRRP